MADEVEISSKIDISQVKEMQIPEGSFPVAYPSSDFRVWISPEAHKRVLKHSVTDTRIELCGVLVGSLRKDDFGPFAIIDEMIEGKYAENRGTQVTFTHDTWEHIYRVLDNEFPDKQILGWYHTHPGFGIFLSSMDLFIHKNFFDLPHQVAFVVDPLSGEDGLFEWKNGNTELAPLYWVGETVYGGKGSRSNQAEKMQPLERQESVMPVYELPHTREKSASSVYWHITQLALILLCLIAYLFPEQIATWLANVIVWAESLLQKIGLG